MFENEPLVNVTGPFADTPLLLIDDNSDNLDLLQKILKWGGFENTHCCTSAQEGLRLLEELQPHLIILDLMMPKMSGYEFLEAVNREERDVFLPILVFTADLTLQAKIKALELGAADFLTKPGDAVEIRLRVQNFLKARQLQVELHHQNETLEEKVRQRTEHLAIAREEAVAVLSRASEYRDDDTGRHCFRVGEISAAVAAKLGMEPEFVESMRLVAPLHDIGKIAIPDHILRKPGGLTDEEFTAMKSHVPIGAELLSGKRSPLLNLAWEIAFYHHERWDGKGYVMGLAGKAIPISARIVTAADAFDAITNDRPYRKGRTPDEALAELVKMSGHQFDPGIVDAMQSLLDPVLRRVAQG